MCQPLRRIVEMLTICYVISTIAGASFAASLGNDNIQDELRAITSELQRQADVIDQLKAENSALQNALASTKSISSWKDDIGPVAFAATVSSQLTCSEGLRVPFDTVISSFGGGYNPLEHEFVCPVRGVYQFSNTIWSQRDYRTDVVMMKGTERQVIANVYGDGRANLYAQGAMQTIVECNTGEKVWMECGGSSTNRIHINGLPANMFSGMLIHAFED